MSVEAGVAARVRKSIFDHFLEHATPPVVEQLMTEFGLSREEATEILRGLESARHIALVRGTARILMAFPFSAIATPFRVTVGGRRYFANCAWDAVAFHSMLGQDTHIESQCHHCAAPIEIELRDGRAAAVQPRDALVYLALPPARWWDDIITTCGNTMVFFASAEHRDSSALCTTAESAVSLSPDQVHQLSGPIYGTKFALDYARPTAAELSAHFAALGLSGDYWKL